VFDKSGEIDALIGFCQHLAEGGEPSQTPGAAA
jgi:hypothetical protein